VNAAKAASVHTGLPLILVTLSPGVGVAAGIALATIPDSSGVVHPFDARSGGPCESSTSA
jgi:hypothetical protein